MVIANSAKTLSAPPAIDRISPAAAAPLERAFFFARPAIEKIRPSSPVMNGIPGSKQSTIVSIPMMRPANAIPLERFSGSGSTTGAGALGSGTGAPQLEQTVRLLGMYEPHLLQYISVSYPLLESNCLLILRSRKRSPFRTSLNALPPAREWKTQTLQVILCCRFRRVLRN